jgi:hypothetical protein
MLTSVAIYITGEACVCAFVPFLALGIAPAIWRNQPNSGPANLRREYNIDNASRFFLWGYYLPRKSSRQNHQKTTAATGHCNPVTLTSCADVSDLSEQFNYYRLGTNYP